MLEADARARATRRDAVDFVGRRYEPARSGRAADRASRARGVRAGRRHPRRRLASSPGPGGSAARRSTRREPVRGAARRAHSVSVGAVALQPGGVLAPARRARRQQPPEARRVVHHLEVADLVLDDVVEDLGRREQQPPVERHRARGRARRPAGALAADRQPRVARAGARASPRPAAGRSPPAPGAGTSARAPRAASPAGTSSCVAAPVHPRAPRLGHQPQRLAQVGHGARARARPPSAARGDRAPAPLDPRRSSRTASSAWRSGERARQHDLDLRRCRRR